MEDGDSSVCICADAEAGGLLPIQALPSNAQARLCNPVCIALSHLAQEKAPLEVSLADRSCPCRPSLSELTNVPMMAQVPRAPSSCTVLFGPPRNGEAHSPLVSGWSIHNEDRSQAALHVMSEWVEVTYLARSSLALSSGDETNHEGSGVLCQIGC